MPLFGGAIGTSGKLAPTAVHVNDVCRRLKDASLPACLSPHSFRVAVITDLRDQGVPWKTCSTWPARGPAHHSALRPSATEGQADEV